MNDIEVKSLEYLRELSRSHDDWQNDPSCLCSDWAVNEIEKLRAENKQLSLQNCLTRTETLEARKAALRLCSRNDNSLSGIAMFVDNICRRYDEEIERILASWIKEE